MKILEANKEYPFKSNVFWNVLKKRSEFQKTFVSEYKSSSFIRIWGLPQDTALYLNLTIEQIFYYNGYGFGMNN